MSRIPILYRRLRPVMTFAAAVVVLLSSLFVAAPPVQAAPDALLSMVEVDAPSINCIFDLDCTITVSDKADHFTPPASGGDAFLQSRLWPQGEPGTAGAGLYAYLYRIDLTHAVAVTARSCITSMRIEFGPIAPLDYNGDGKPDHVFVVTKGGLGNVKPTSADLTGTTLTLKFDDPPICPGSQSGGGDTSYFIGLASTMPHHDVNATLTTTTGPAVTLDAWAPRLRDDTRINIRESTNKVFSAGVELPSAQLVPILGPDQISYTHFLLPGIDPYGTEPGLPDVPISRHMLGVPRGAQVRIAKLQVEQGDVFTGIELWPSQPSAADLPMRQEVDEPPANLFEDPPFTKNQDAYAGEQPYPAEIVDVQPMGSLRDLDLVQINIAGGQYIPAKKTLMLFKAVNFELVFEGGAEGFLPEERVKNPFEQSFDGIYSQALNHAAIQQYLIPGSIVWVCWGHEFLIITHPDFRPAADALRNWKVSIGLSTAVFETGNGPGQIGSTKEQIRDFIRSRYDTCLVRPSYVLLLGDAEKIPTFYRTTHYGDSAGSDLDYSLMNNADIMPDLAYGRIPVDTLADAQRVIDKIIQYEDNPPFAPAFYNNLSFASYFQCCRPDVAQDGTASRSFIETSELVRGKLQSQGYSVERIYNTSTAYHDDPTKSSYYNTAVRDDTPNRYYNGTLLPVDLRASSGYPWDGDTSDIVNAINEGRFLVLHRDHGWTNGWGDPSFTTGNLGSLSNGNLTPVVYSINCASGLFDNETLNPAAQAWPYSNNAGYVSWAEQMLRMEGGAVGIIGDTRVSPTWANSALTRGLFDATWPSVLPSYGGATPIRRLGDILNYGKAYMVSQVGVAQTAGSVGNADANTNVVLYHVLGDPTLKLYTSFPYKINIPWYVYEVLTIEPPFWQVRYPVNGALITALQDGNPVARAQVVDGKAQLDFIHDLAGDQPLALSILHPDGASATLNIPEATGRITPEAGGMVSYGDGKFKLAFGAGAVDAPTDIFYDELNGPGLLLPAVQKGLRYFNLDAFDEAESDGNPALVTQFHNTYHLVLGYNDAELEEQDV
ncbi:MAG TPA: C25 family cysteine peptidase, partial [Caldilineaceae bacterium]|nr:C25 family cysteine peptidase [Caldilineaceae bacterium]